LSSVGEVTSNAHCVNNVSACQLFLVAAKQADYTKYFAATAASRENVSGVVKIILLSLQILKISAVTDCCCAAARLPAVK